MSGHASRFVLGTAQFGLDYGIANVSGSPGASEAARILAVAREAGVNHLDTAIAYGDSEARLGELGVEGFEVMTKLPAIPADCADVGAWVRAQVDGSIARLRVDRIAALSLHRPAEALGPRGEDLLAAMRGERERGRVGAIGVSVYGPEELQPLFELFDFDLVQAPANVFDRRMAKAGWRSKLRTMGHALDERSCFLQGLLLLAPDRRPPWCGRWSALFARWDAFLLESGLSALEACVRCGIAGDSRLVVGVDSAAQLEAILAVSGGPLRAPEELACDDPDLVNPSRWPTPEK